MRPYRYVSRGLLILSTLLAGALPGVAGEPPAAHCSWLNPLRYWDIIRANLPTMRQPEALEMIGAILDGSEIGPGTGWFHPGLSRYGWDWFIGRFDADHDGSITRKEFHGPVTLFERLDRNHDGVLTSEDFDWSNRSVQSREAQMAGGLFYMLDTNSNGRISRDEWEGFFAKAARGKNYLTREDLREALTEAPGKPKGTKGAGEPSRLMLLTGLFAGEIGSLHEGPGMNELAPDFTLPTHDGKRLIRLGQLHARKPIVLIFGSFT